jgi:hypothetical protein
VSGGPVVPVPDDMPVHRIGGGSSANLALTPADASLNPPGISTLQGGSSSEAAQAMRRQFPRMAPRGRTVVGTAMASEVRAAGFDVIMDPTRRFPQHARLIHPQGIAGFTEANLQRLSQCFRDHAGL